METIFAVLGFGVIVIGGFFWFAYKKLQIVSDERVCVCTDTEKKDGVTTSFKRYNEVLADFRERRNEFWNSLGQFVIIIAIITLLVLLLILGKISSEAAVPLISGLGSFAVGKSVTSFRNTTSPENQHIGQTNQGKDA
jgi:uncharacterized membrane protein